MDALNMRQVESLAEYHCPYPLRPTFIFPQSRYIYTYSLPGLVVKGASHVDCAGHVFHRKCSAYVTACDLVSNSRGYNQQKYSMLLNPEWIQMNDIFPSTHNLINILFDNVEIGFRLINDTARNSGLCSIK